MAANLFWSNVNTDPKRNFRFTLNIGNIPVWTVKSVSKPKANVATIEHSFINHVFKYPGRVTWDNLSVTLVDPVDPDLAFTLLESLRRSGYQYPTTENVRGSISKEQAVQDGLQSISLSMIDNLGNPIETWALKNPWIVTLDYTSDDMSNIAVEIAYDWAEITRHGNLAT